MCKDGGSCRVFVFSSNQPETQHAQTHRTEDPGLKVFRDMNETTRVKINGFNNYHSLYEVQTVSFFCFLF